MDYRIFNVRTDVNACDCTRGCTDTLRQRAGKSERERERERERDGVKELLR